MNANFPNLFQGSGGRYRPVDELKKQRLIQDQDLAEIFANYVRIEEVPFGTRIITAGEPDIDLIFILSGEFFVRSGRQVITRRSAGEHVGEMALVDPDAHRSANVTAGCESVVARISEPNFSAIAARYALLWRRVAQELADSLRRANRREPRSFRAVAVSRLH